MSCSVVSPQHRSRVIFATSWLNVAVNVLLSCLKIAIGVLTNSIAVVSEGVNNATDIATSVITMVGTKLSQKRPTRKHPFGYGRIEYLTSLLIGTLILLTGIELLKSSVHLLIHPEELKVTVVSVVVLVISVVVKLAMGIYTIIQGRKVDSKALVAVGEESRSDSIVSAVTIVSIVIFLVFGKSVDAWAGMITAFFVLRAAWEVLKDTIAALLGQPVDKELADELYRVIRSTDGVINAVDMALHNYGPNAYTGSVNIEIDHKRTLGEIYEVIHALQLRIMHEYHVTMVFGMYAVDKDSPTLRGLREDVVRFVRDREHIQSCHAIYVAPNGTDLYCDFIVDYDLRDWEKVQADFREYIHGIHPEFNVVLTIETEFV